MDKSDFEQAITRLDQLLQARREELERRKRHEEQLALIRFQREALQERLRSSAEIGADDLAAEARRLLDALTAEEAALLGPSPAPPPPPPPAPEPPKVETPAPVAEAPPPPPPEAAPAETASSRPAEEDWRALKETQAAAEALVKEVEETLPRMHDQPPELRNARFLTWSLRWRILEERAEREFPSAVSTLRWAFAQLMEARKSIPDVPFLRAFHTREKGDWVKELAAAEAQMKALKLKFPPPRTKPTEMYSRRKEEETKAELRTQAAIEALDLLAAVPTQFILPEDPEGVKAFRERARNCLRFLRKLGPSLRQVCGPFRDLLEGEEFDPIWSFDAGPVNSERPRAAADVAERRRTWSRRDLLERMLRRMLAKKEIGGKHTEIGNLYQGLPDHVRGDAKEGVQLLVREGILRVKPTTKDDHVSIEPSFVRVVEDLVTGKDMPPSIARWMETEPVRQ